MAKRTSKPSKEPESVRLSIDYENAPERIYANHVEYAVQPYEVTLVFGEVDLQKNKPVKNKASGDVETKVQPKVRLVLPHPVFESLAKILRTYLEKHSSRESEG